MVISRDVCRQIVQNCYIVSCSIKFQENSPNMSLIPALVLELLKFIVRGPKRVDPISTGGFPPRVLLFACNFLFLSQFLSKLVTFPEI